jgi:hypothetical protein
MILTDYYKFQKLTDAASRYDVTHSTASYDLFENLLTNKRKFNVGGLSFNYVDRPKIWKGDAARIADKAFTKGQMNLSSIYVPDLQKPLIAYGDFQGTHDALLIFFSADYETIEVFIARGYANDMMAIYTHAKESELIEEMETIRAKAKPVFKGQLPNQ